MNRQKTLYAAAILLLATLALNAAPLKAWMPFTTGSKTYMLDVENNVATEIIAKPSGGFKWTLDGKKIGYVLDSAIWVMNNDGTDQHKLMDYPGWKYKEGQTFSWTSHGLVTKIAGDVYLYDTTDMSRRKIFSTSGWQSDDKTGSYGGGVVASDNGQVMTFGWRYWESTWYMPYIWFDESLNNPQVRWMHIWYHGSCMTPDGKAMVGNNFGQVPGLIAECGNHATITACSIDPADFTQNTSITDGYNTISLSSFCNDFSSTDGEEPYTSMRACRRCANNSDYTVYSMGGAIQASTWIVNWKTLDKWEIKYGGVISTGTGACSSNWCDATFEAPGDFWLGDRTASNVPSIALATNKAVFTIDNGGSSQTKDIAISNGGANTLPSLSATVSSGASWLTASVGGSENAQTLSLTANPASLSEGSYNATVTVSGSGVASQNVGVTLNYGSSVVAPSDLEGRLGNDGRSVDLVWIDNASDETGFSIERAMDGGTFQEVGTTGANAASYADEVTVAGLATYRVRAVKGSTKSVASNEVDVDVTNVVVFAVTNPSEGDILTPGDEITVEWYAPSDVTPVMVKLSTDGGLSWSEIQHSGGINNTDADWGAMGWTVPNSISSTCIIRVHQYESFNNGAQTGQFSIDTANGLVAYYPFDTDANNELGTGMNGTVTDATLVAGLTGQAYSFTGSGNITIDYGTSMSFGATDSFTFSVWVKRTAATTWQSVLSLSKPSTPWTGIWLSDAGSWVYGGSSNITGPTSTTEWTHVTVVQDGDAGTRTLYVDGQAEGTGSASDAGATGSLIVGSCDASQFGFTGALDELKLFARALSASEVSNLTDAGKLPVMTKGRSMGLSSGARVVSTRGGALHVDVSPRKATGMAERATIAVYNTLGRRIAYHTTAPFIGSGSFKVPLADAHNPAQGVLLYRISYQDRNYTGTVQLER